MPAVESVNINSYLENVEDENQKRARGDPTSTVTIIPSTDFATKILPRAITEITALAELVDNAIEATNDLDDRVERIVRVQFDHQARTLSIEDNGCGMDSRRVVECFSLGHSERSADNLEAAHKSAAKEIEAVSNVRLTACLREDLTVTTVLSTRCWREDRHLQARPSCRNCDPLSLSPRRQHRRYPPPY